MIFIKDFNTYFKFLIEISTIDTVYEGTNIFKIESKYIKEYYNKYPKLSLNIAGITEEMKSKVNHSTNKLF